MVAIGNEEGEYVCVPWVGGGSGHWASVRSEKQSWTRHQKTGQWEVQNTSPWGVRSETAVIPGSKSVAHICPIISLDLSHKTQMQSIED